MSFIGKLVSFAALSSVAVSAAFAQSLPPSVAACASEKDSLTRLVCFDREVAKFTQSATSVAPAPAAPAVTAPSAPPVATTQHSTASPTDDDFGVAGALARKREAAREAVAPSPKELHAAITKISTKPYGELVLELDNGQIWQQNEKEETFGIKVGEQIVIKPAKFGSFILTAASGAVTRVRRVR